MHILLTSLVSLTLYSPGSQWIIQPATDLLHITWYYYYFIPSNLQSHSMHSAQCMLHCIKILCLYFWCQLSAWCLYVLVSLLPSFPSLVLFYTASDRKLGGHGCLWTRLCSTYEVILHIYMYWSIHKHGSQAPVLEHVYTWAQLPGSNFRARLYMSTVARLQF